MFASSRQRPQRRWLERGSEAGRGALGKVSPIYFWADAGFANPEVYEFLEAEGIKYAIRLPANRVLQERIGYLLTPLAARRMTCAGPMQASPTKQEAGRDPAG